MLSVSMLFLFSCEKDEDPGSDNSYTDVMASQVKSNLVDDASISPYEAIFMYPHYTARDICHSPAMPAV